MSTPQLPLSSNSKTKMFSLSGHPKIIIIKENTQLTLRSALIVAVTPFKLQQLFSVIDLFHDPFSISLSINLLSLNKIDSYSCIFFLDLDVSQALTDDFNKVMKESIHMLKLKLDLLFKTIALKNFEVSKLRGHEIFSVMNGKSCKKVKQFSYPLQAYKEIDFFKKTIFSNNKIKQIDFKRDSIIPQPTITIGKSLSGKEIGVDSHVLFLTGKQDYRRDILSILLDHFTKDDTHHIFIFDFGLGLTLDKTFHRNFVSSDVMLDPFTFSDGFLTHQRSTFISHLSFIAKNILRLRDREVNLLEDKLTSFFSEGLPLTLQSFLGFISDEFSESLLESNGNGPPNSFSQPVSQSTDYTSLIKNAQAPSKSYDLESLVSKIKYLTFLLGAKNRESFTTIVSKNHLDIFSITTTPDQKALFFYLFNLYFTLNEHLFKNYKFFFLDINAMLFDNFNDFDISWLHPTLRQSLFDSSDIFSVKKIFTLLETRIYTSFVSNAPYALLAQATKDNIDKLQYMHNYSLIESPSLQRQEFFRITAKTSEVKIDLPSYELFSSILKLLFNPEIEFTFVKLFSIYLFSRRILIQLIKSNYLRKHKSQYLLTEKSLTLKKTIIEYLSYQASLTIEENDFLIKISDPIAYNVFFNDCFSFTENIDLILTRFLANQLVSMHFNAFLLYQFLRFRQQLIDIKELSFFLVFGMQLQENSPSSASDQIITPDVSSSESASMQDYLSEIQQAITETDTPTQPISSSPKPSKIEILSQQVHPQTSDKDVNALVNQINDRLHAELTDLNVSFPARPIFFAMKFLKSETREILQEDLNNLNALTGKYCKLEVQ